MPKQLEPGRIVGGDYRIVRPLAEGGMGAVYLAEQASTGKRRALKVMHLSIAADQASVQRFVREAQVGARIESEHVVEVIGAGVDGETGLPWLAMELLEGGALSTVVERQGPLPPQDVLRIYRQMAHALCAAHRAGIVHRDLKPENVFVATSRRSDTPLTVKILDFGIAKLVAGATSASNSQLIGSPLWMAPEQLQPNAPIGPQTDVWALGLMAFYLLTGRAYWLAANQAEVGIQALIAELLVSPLVAASDRAAQLGAPARLPPGFDAWFARAVAREPAARFASTDELLAALVPVLESAPASTTSGAVVSVSPTRDAAPLPGTVVGGPASAASSWSSGSSSGPASGSSLGLAPTQATPAPVAAAIAARTTSPVVTTARAGRSPLLAGSVALVAAGLVAIAVTAVVLSQRGGGATGGAAGVDPATGDDVSSAREAARTEAETTGIATTQAASERGGAADAGVAVAQAAPHETDERATTAPSEGADGGAERTRANRRNAGPGSGTIPLGNLGPIRHGGSGDSGGAGRRSGSGASAAAPGGGSLSPAQIREVARRGSGPVRYCYERALVSRPALQGRVTVRFVISPSGSVSSASVASSSLHDASVEACIVAAVRRWRFPPAEGGGSVTVNYPYDLRPTD